MSAAAETDVVVVVVVRNNIIVRILCQSLYNISWFTDSYGAPDVRWGRRWKNDKNQTR